jgi:hypothetical protein
MVLNSSASGTSNLECLTVTVNSTGSFLWTRLGRAESEMFHGVGGVGVGGVRAIVISPMLLFCLSC